MDRKRAVVGSGLVLLGLVAALGGCTFFDQGPIADFQVKPVVVYAGETVTLDAGLSSGAAGIVSYEWSTSDNQSLVGQQVTTAFADPGTHTVTLVVQDANGNVDEAEQDIVAYLRSGTVLLDEDFSDDDMSLARWVLDPTWASVQDAEIDYISGDGGYALYVHSPQSRWHRRYYAVDLPPLRVGQWIEISCRIMVLRNQDGYTYMFAPGRKDQSELAGSLPSFVFSNAEDGCSIHEPTVLGTDTRHPIGYLPDVYRWHTYRFAFSQDSYVFDIDEIEWFSGALNVSLNEGARWSIVLGEESLEESCSVYYDDIRVVIKE